MSNENPLGNKLYAFRKQARLSQESLAEQLNVSRQAVSKWECGEALPDTENLIALAKLYNLSLDELIGNIPQKEELTVIQTNPQPPSSPSQCPQNEVTETTPEDTDGENGESNKQTEEDEYEDEEDICANEKVGMRIFRALPYPILITIAYLLWGFLGSGWAIGWTLYLTVPVYYSILTCIKSKKASRFAYPVLIAFIYCFVGMKWGFWHPNWVLFITVPIYYAITSAIEKK